MTLCSFFRLFFFTFSSPSVAIFWFWTSKLYFLPCYQKVGFDLQLTSISFFLFFFFWLTLPLFVLMSSLSISLFSPHIWTSHKIVCSKINMLYLTLQELSSSCCFLAVPLVYPQLLCIVALMFPHHNMKSIFFIFHIYS